MKNTNQILLVCLLIFFSCHSYRYNRIYDGFETSSLSKIWETDKFIPGAVEIQPAIIRSGKKAAKIIIHPGDQIDEEKGTILERAELMESMNLWALEDSTYSYAFSMFIPQDFPIVPTRLVIAQWKQRCPVENCDPDNPVIAVRYIAGELSVDHKIGPKNDFLYRTSEDIRNKWLDFKFQIRFSRQQNGQIKAWLNDKVIVDYEGINAYPAQGGYSDRNYFYFKMGLYRDHMSESMILYVDAYSKQQLQN